MSSKHLVKAAKRKAGKLYYSEKFTGLTPEELAREIALANLRDRVEIGASLLPPSPAKKHHPRPNPKAIYRPPIQLALLPQRAAVPLETLATEEEFLAAMGVAFLAQRTCFTPEALAMLLSVGEQSLMTTRAFRAGV